MTTTTSTWPPFVYFQAGGPDDLFLVETTLFTRAGDLPPGSKFVRMFGGSMQRPAPLGEHKGLPVYGLPIPATVFREMLNGMRFLSLLPGLFTAVPDAIKATVPLGVWQAYLTDWGLHIEPGDVDAFVMPEEDGVEAKEPPPKRRRLDEPPVLFLIRRVARALVATIKAEHPGWSNFSSGVEYGLRCEFVHTTAVGSL